MLLSIDSYHRNVRAEIINYTFKILFSIKSFLEFLTFFLVSVKKVFLKSLRKLIKKFQKIQYYRKRSFYKNILCKNERETNLQTGKIGNNIVKKGLTKYNY